MAVRVCAVGALGAFTIGLSGCGGSDSTTQPPLTDQCDTTSWTSAIHNSTPTDDMDHAPTDEDYATLVAALDIVAVKHDLKALLTESNPCWPADFGNYGPLFIRNAWHCSGSYRKSDNKGGCSGGSHRFEPQRSWDDNTNLDKARALLNPIKEKYGDALSWGDLIVAAGSVALKEMGAPISQICFGRIDAPDGTDAIRLGPSPEQERYAPCPINGNCSSPLGSTTVGLIYVNPEGPVTEEGGEPDPTPSKLVAGVRDSFERMDHSDRATVALIGGGHAFGKVHGACPSTANAPAQGGKGYLESTCPAQGEDATRETCNERATLDGLPWLGNCDAHAGGKGRGNNTFTSGFEGAWTLTPTTWSNQFFKDLAEKEWELWIGPGGHNQWRIKDATGPEASLMRLTSDMALLEDPIYRPIVEEFASNITALNLAFDDAWFELTAVHGSQWSRTARCDHGPPPSTSHGMLDSDISV